MNLQKLKTKFQKQKLKREYSLKLKKNRNSKLEVSARNELRSELEYHNKLKTF